MQQANDFLEESRDLEALLSGGDDGVFHIETQFKAWTIKDIIGHLHMFNVAARLALEGSDQFEKFVAPISAGLSAGKSMLDLQNPWLGGLSGSALFAAWRDEFGKLSDIYAEANPKQRIKWFGPDMSTRSSITARQMETWAHGQAVYDILGVARQDEDRLKNIAHLGVSTFAWTFINRKQPVPDPMPYVRLHAPSGEMWEWGQPQSDNCVEGSATGFCQTVAQTRNVADTDVKSIGTAGKKWMEIAQCFAGRPHDPPKPGERCLSNTC